MTTQIKSTNHDSPNGNYSTQPSRTSKWSRIGLALTMTTTLLCGLAVTGLATESFAQTTLEQAKAEHPDWVQIPGKLVRPDCVHVLPKGATVEIDSDGNLTGNVTMDGEFLAHYDACPEKAIATRPHVARQNNGTSSLVQAPSTGNGWVEDDQWDVPLSSSDNIDYMQASLVVPSYPSLSGALIYLFNGISDSNEQVIIQPVLQYGSNNLFGGNYWGIASWIVGPDSYYVSPLETVNPGDVLLGYTQMTSISGNTLYWTSVAKDQTSGAYSYIKVWTSGYHFTWAYRGVLEAYNVNYCANFPASGRAVFGNPIVDHDFPYYRGLTQQWKGAIFGYGGPSCRFAVVAASGTLDF